MASDRRGTMGGWVSSRHGWQQLSVGRGADTLSRVGSPLGPWVSGFATSRISQCHPTEEEEESLADDGEDEELRRTWRRASTSFAPIRISI